MSGNGQEPDYDIHPRLKHQIDLIFDELEANPDHYTLKERLAVVTTVGMYLTRDVKLREADEQQQSNAGAAVRKYATAFKTNVARGRAGNSRPAKGTRGARTDSEQPDSSELDV
jgi:hypothetical protein